MHPIDPAEHEHPDRSGRATFRTTIDDAIRRGGAASEHDASSPVLGDRSSPGGRGVASSDPGDGRSPEPIRTPRAELRRVDAVNEALGDASRRLAEAATAAGIEAALDRLSGTEPYEVAAFLGTIDRWKLPEAGPDAASLPATADGRPAVWQPRSGVPASLAPFEAVPDADHDSWALLPVRSGPSTYGHLVLATDRPAAFGDLELAILKRFGGTLGRAIDAAADRRLLRSDAVVELTIECSEDALAAIARATDCRLALDGLVAPGVEDRNGNGNGAEGDEREVLAYVHTEGTAAGRVADAAGGVDGVGTPRPIDDGRLELPLTGASAVVPLSEAGTNLRTVEVDPPTPAAVEAVVEVAPGTDLRALFDRIRAYASDAQLAAKRDRSRPTRTDADAAGPGTGLGSLGGDALTDRQREAVEAAYRSGYFEWPRDRTGEEIAERIGISPPTFHNHLRTAERTLLSTLFDGAPRPTDGG